MRTIKFRVWDKEIKKMHICGEDVHDEITFENETNKAYYYNLQNGCGSLREDSDYILMQYIGLKDKNETEIYEGDIVRILGGEYEQGFYEWDETVIIKDLVYDGFNLMMTINQIGNGAIEVIGNIYENKNLLRQEER